MCLILDSRTCSADEFHGDSSRKLSLEEARRLSIVSFSTSPEDEEKNSKLKAEYARDSRSNYSIYKKE